MDIYVVYTHNGKDIESLVTLKAFKSQEEAELYIGQVLGTDEDEGEISWILVTLHE